METPAETTIMDPNYGSIAVEELPQKRANNSFKANLVPICLTILVPWVLFVIVLAVMSLPIRHSTPIISYMVVMCSLSLAGSMSHFGAHMAARGKDPIWFSLMGHFATAAVVLGCIFGSINYYSNIQPIMDALRLNNYEDVDAIVPGSQMMDAGQISFKEDSVLDLTSAMAFHSGHTYCVAPIVKRGINQKISTGLIDFWAVGKDCCSGNPKDFHCGEYDNPGAHAGLRVTNAEEVPMYKFAVKQAEAAYSIQSKHPVFVTWVQDPLDEIASAKDTAIRYIMAGLWNFLLAQCSIIGTLAVFLTSLGATMMQGLY